jgi:hypothetical protein
MSKQHTRTRRDWRGWVWRRRLPCGGNGVASAQQPPAAGAPQAQLAPPQVARRAAGKITPEQARQLFGLVDELIKFSSDETGLPIKSRSSARSPPAPRWKAT